MTTTRWPWIWMYHSVDDYSEDPYRVTVTPERFARQMAWLAARRLRGVGVAELLEARRHGPARDLVGLTFDDGYRDFLHRAVPVLRRHGFTATVYVLSGRLGGTNAWDVPGPVKRLMTADEVRATAAEGMEVASHGVAHVSLPAGDADGLRDEVGRSRAELADLVGGPVTGFAYPYGHVGHREIDAVRSAGYAHAAAIAPHERAGRHALPRTFVGDRDGGMRLRAKDVRRQVRVPDGEATFV
ncbi:polysaccharide deacetylase family protein [Pseudonocardia sp. ICBG1293]|uniref:polysaccharide deacetylase family protein n=1 Tax=Pseudonocardia sp. ICBG1293 TaxID=2844382 RepID=UPI001CCAB015|nr:polysaccharide deacetylase family protein [Pseudonocardia sp. ICBG1293]